MLLLIFLSSSAWLVFTEVLLFFPDKLTTLKSSSHSVSTGSFFNAFFSLFPYNIV
jgi:hypothetical protein